MLSFIDSLLDRITMYRLLIYYLCGLLAAAAGLSQLGYLHYNPLMILFTPLYLLAVCWITNTVFAHVFEAPTNQESTYITSLILALIISPVNSPKQLLLMTAAGGLAMASKYILAIHKKHLFNPAAIAVLLTSLGASQSASWWVGSALLLPFVVVGGLLLTCKIRRFQMVISFIASTLIATTVYTLLSGGNITITLQKVILSSALFFLAFVMLTEPLTSPSTIKNQRWYGILAGLLFPPQAHFLTLYSSPELVLTISNIFAYFVSPRLKVFPTLTQKIKLAPDIVDFVFKPKEKLSYQPGQYMEWTLPHKHYDSRGERRYFTLSSSPTESTIRLGVKFYKNGSSFKKAMLGMDDSTPFVGAQLGGDFVLPADKTRKLAFIAGGIGVTPYRSMLKYQLDNQQAQPITMLYSASTAAELVYTDVFEEARQRLGTKITYFLTNPQTALPNRYCRPGLITAETIQQEIPDYAERLFYLAGSHQMVNAIQNILQGLGVPSTSIKVDFFPGYA